MASPASGANTSKERPTVMIKLGRLTVKGPVAVALILGALLGGVATLVVRSRPSLGMLISGGLWVAFVVYWSVAAKNAAATKTSEAAKSRQLHQILLNVALLLLFIPVPGLVRRYLPLRSFILPAGLALQCAAFLLAIWARRHLGRNWSAAVTITMEHQLVRSGPYRWVRHPIYTAMFGMFIGTAVVSGQMHSLIAVALLAVAYGRKLRMEERALGEVFGAEYEAYRRRTWALLPGLL